MTVGEPVQSEKWPSRTASNGDSDDSSPNRESDGLVITFRPMIPGFSDSTSELRPLTAMYGTPCCWALGYRNDKGQLVWNPCLVHGSTHPRTNGDCAIPDIATS